jgi:hypothetical protein
MVDYALWMLPFVAKSDLTKAALKANISHEAANDLLKMLLEEHSRDGAHVQLERLWTEWYIVQHHCYELLHDYCILL